MQKQRDVHHSHSGLIRRLDEVEAHIEALSNCRDCGLIYSELRAYTREFYDHLIAHIEHEETELFPSVRDPDRVTLLHLQLQHLTLVEWAALLKRRVIQVRVRAAGGPPDVRDIAELVDEIREELRSHSAGEAAFFRGEAFPEAHGGELT
jgi:iron-sulfur cluster repair protein YtfE (RIC family)